MPIPTGRFWAKFDAEQATWHPLIAHSADVAAVLSRLLEDGSPIAARLARAAGLERLVPEVRAALIYLAALHDFGKANHGFQEKILPPGTGRRWPESGHVKVVLKSLPSTPSLQRVIAEMLHAFAGHPMETADLLIAALCHHGRPYGKDVEPALLGRLWSPEARPGWDPIAMIRRLIHHARRWSGLDEFGAPVVVPNMPLLTHLFAGALTLSDWIGSTGSVFAPTPSADDDPDGYWDHVLEKARYACARIGVVPETRVTVQAGVEALSNLFPKIFPVNEPTPLQKHVAEMALPGPGSRVLIESETGSGKTEAVLALYARLRAMGKVSGLVFALPTRATATAMHDRVLEALPGVYRDSVAPTVALAMGGAHVRASTNESLIAEPPRTFDDSDDRELTAWASSGAKKFFAAEIVIATIDQVLLSGLLTKHAHMRLALLSRHLLVVDELHSYDRYMAEVLGRVVDFHTAAGGIAAFMSATLSSVERARYGGTPDDVPTMEEAVQRPYPLLSVCAGPGMPWRDEPMEVSATSDSNKTIAWHAALEAQALASAVAAAQVGARVCVLRNTVKDARTTVERIRESGGSAFLWRPSGSAFTPAYHSRYTQPDRMALDRAVLASFGKDAQGAGIILVATQVAEQSLDVDFDYMVTDLCPIDVLLQRIGRLHRHRRTRPTGYEIARITVIAPEKPIIDYVHGDRMSGPHGWGTVYGDPGDLELTLRLVRDPAWSTISIPRHNRELIERVYHPTPREALAKESMEWEKAFIVNEGKNLGRIVHARGAAVDFQIGYVDNGPRFDPGAERRIRTRLGDDSIRVEIGAEVPAFYADPDRTPPVTTVDLPYHVVGDLPEGELAPRVSEISVTADGIQFLVNGKGPIRYDAAGWHWS